MDLLIQICADALSLEIFILQNNEGNIQVLHVPSATFAKKIYLKFTHNNKYSAANHYIPLIKNPKCKETTPWPNGYIIKPGSKSEQTEVIDLSATSTCLQYLKSQDEERNDEPSIPFDVVTLDHSYAQKFEDCQSEDEDEYPEQWNVHHSSHINSSQKSTNTQEEEEIENCDEMDTEYNGEEQGSDVDEPEMPQIKKGKLFLTYLWDDVKPIECTEIPKDINGFKKYVVHMSNNTWHEDTADSRYFELKTSSRSKFKGIRKGSKYHSSWACGNDKCGFQKTSVNHQPNYVNWIYMDNNRKAKICTICQHYPKREECSARKLVEYDDKSETAIVYHTGQHKCHEKLD